jgi:hypothetical protein
MGDGETKGQSRVVVYGGGFLAIVVLLALFANALGLGPEPTITLAEYSRLSDGISYSAAAAIVGTQGVETSRVAIPETPSLLTIAYSWKNDDGSNAIVMFQGDKLISKSQVGLK